MVISPTLGRAALISVSLIAMPMASASWAYVQTLVPSGVTTLVDNTPLPYGEAVLMWTTTPLCIQLPPPIPPVPNGLFPALISRASSSIATPREIFNFNPPRAIDVCNPYILLSNVYAFGDYLYFIDNQGDGTANGALRRLRRDANPGDEPEFLKSVGSISGAKILVVRNSVYAILTDSEHDFLEQFDKDSGALIDSQVEFPSSRLAIRNLKYDGRFLYWTHHGALRRKDLDAGGLVTVLNGPIQTLYTGGYEEQCSSDGCQDLSPIVYSQGGDLYDADGISGQSLLVYHSPDRKAEITDITRDSTNYYFIEARPDGPGLEVDGRIYRVDVVDFRPDLIYGPVNNGGAGLTGLRTDGIWLYFQDRDDRSLRRVSNDELAIPVHDLRGTRLEVTQGLQDAAQSVRLIENKRTVVRFYVRSVLPEAVAGVSAVLTGSNSNGPLGRLEPVNFGSKLITVVAEPMRSNLDRSFQFELPANWTTGGRLTLTATINPDQRIIEDNFGNNSAGRGVDFTPSERALVIYYNFAYDLGGTRYTPGAGDVAASRRRLRQLYPLGEPGSAFESPGLHTVTLDFVDNNLTDKVDRTNADCIKNHPKAADRNMCASDYVHARMRTLRSTSAIAPDTVSYGNIAQAAAPMGLNYFTRGYASGQYTSGPSGDINYAAHEVGHTFGRSHPVKGFRDCGHSASDPDYPYVNGFIADFFADVATRPAGLDFPDRLPGTMTFLNAGTQFDTMTYCVPNWISDYTFEALYQYLISNTRPRSRPRPRGALAGDWLLVNGMMIPEENVGGFTWIERTNSVMDATPPAPGPFTLQLRNSSAVLASYPFAAQPIEERPGQLVFDLVVALAPGTTELRVVENATQEVLATKAISAHAPVISDIQLHGVSNPVDGIATVTWNASDADGEPLLFDIFAVRNGDPSYRPIQLGNRGTSVDLDTTMLGGGTNTLRVVASDGVNTAYAESATFTVAARAPKIFITSPVDQSRSDWGQLITLRAEVDDVQDQIVSQVHWSSNRAGELGSGRWLQTDRLPVGENVLTVTATNSLGASASASVTVHVGDVLMPPGPTLSVAPQIVAWHVADDNLASQVASVSVENQGKGDLEFDVTSDQPWLQIDAAAAISEAVAPRTFSIAAAPALVPIGVTSRATLTFANRADPDDVLAVPVELSRGNVFDHTGAAAVCNGDCDGGGSVTVDELVLAVNIALETVAIGQCTAIDIDANGQATIDELLRAVTAALENCG